MKEMLEESFEKAESIEDIKIVNTITKKCLQGKGRFQSYYETTRPPLKYEQLPLEVKLRVRL